MTAPKTPKSNVAPMLIIASVVLFLASSVLLLADHRDGALSLAYFALATRFTAGVLQ